MFVPFSIYQNKNGTRIITYPRKIEKNYENPKQDGENTLVDIFYAINPMFRPIPSYMSLFSIKIRDSYPYNISEIKREYDPFNVSEDIDAVFITWLEPIPYGTPLYIYKEENGYYPSLVKINSKRFTEVDFSPIYVLTKEARPDTIFLEEEKDYFKVVNGIPQFRFEKYMGRCIPNPQGEKLENCTLTNDLNLVKPQSLLKYLDENKREKKKEGFFIFFVILILLLFVLVYKQIR